MLNMATSALRAGGISIRRNPFSAPSQLRSVFAPFFTCLINPAIPRLRSEIIPTGMEPAGKSIVVRICSADLAIPGGEEVVSVVAASADGTT